MERGDVRYYFRQRPVTTALLAIAGGAVGLLAAWGVMWIAQPPGPVAMVLYVAGLLAGSAISRLLIDVLMGPDD